MYEQKSIFIILFFEFFFILERKKEAARVSRERKNQANHGHLLLIRCISSAFLAERVTHTQDHFLHKQRTNNDEHTSPRRVMITEKASYAVIGELQNAGIDPLSSKRVASRYHLSSYPRPSVPHTQPAQATYLVPHENQAFNKTKEVVSRDFQEDFYPNVTSLTTNKNKYFAQALK